MLGLRHRLTAKALGPRLRWLRVLQSLVRPTGTSTLSVCV